jgi:hypothetical protein
MSPLDPFSIAASRRQFLQHTSLGLGVAALHCLGGNSAAAARTGAPPTPLLSPLQIAPRAKRVIYLFQAGGPSQLELLDYKPQLDSRFQTELPDSVRQGQRITGMVSGQGQLLIAPSRFGFTAAPNCGTPIGNLLPFTQKIGDRLCVVNSLHTDAINHDPAITFIQSGSQQPGRPSMGSWIDYGIGSECDNLPAFVVLISTPSNGRPDQGLLSRLWGSGFLPTRHQGVKLRSAGEPVDFLENPAGLDPATRRSWLTTLEQLNQRRFDAVGDPEIQTRIAQYELAARMQTSVPELADVAGEPESTFALYGDEARKPGTYARNCLMARRLAERGVRFIQLYHRGWDHHGDLPNNISSLAQDVDQASAALVLDLEQRGLLEDTLVIWGGEFGRTVYSQGAVSRETYGRDHHGRAFSLWMAGGGVKPGMRYGRTDDFSFNVVENPVHIHDLQATVLACLGIDHERLTYAFQGRQYRLTDVHGSVVRDILN